MENLTYISSAGIRVVVGARRTLAGKQGSVVMTRLRPQVEKVFEIVKALPNLQVFRSEQELDAYLSAMQRRVVQGG
jgi:anti-anti-sigma factor